MSGTEMWTLSPWMPLNRAERRVRREVARDGGCWVAATKSDERQLRRLKQLYWRLEAEPGLGAHLGDHQSSGAVYLIVWSPGRRWIGWPGEPKIDAPTEGGLDYWGVPAEPEAG